MNGRFVFLAIVFISAAIFGNCEGAHVQKRILNGEDSEYVPYVTMVTGMVTGTHQIYSTYGGGSFITLQHVLTAANLLYGMNNWNIDYGTNTIGSFIWENATAIHHPDYDPGTFANNIGILFLHNPVSSDLVIPIPLPELRDTPYENEQGRLAGFGLMETENNYRWRWINNPVKQTGYYRRIADSSCDNLLGAGTTIPENSFCAQDLDYESSICYGDHGSGLTVYIDEVNTLVGIVSVFTNMCNRDFPVIFTKVSAYTEWIRQQIDTV